MIMKLILILSLLTISLAELWIIDEFPDEIDQSLNGYWLEFKSKYNKSYDSAEEEIYRRLVWESNLAFINDHNSMKWRDFSLRMNKFGDISHEEFKEMMNGLKFDKELEIIDDLVEERLALDLPGEIDWRKEGYVTEVKDQGQCGSCWAFSAVAALEGQHFKKSGKLVSLSEQNLVDCSSSYGNEGCNGGLMDQAFEYVKDNKGIDTENSYPYTAHDGECKYNPKNSGATDEGYKDIGPVGSEQALMQAIVQIGPVSIAIDASHRSFQFYSEGVYNEPGCSSTDLDHGVAAVGYGTDQKSGRDYYIVKNSWGTGWGIDGYVLMARNAKNMCGVATAASYPLV